MLRSTLVVATALIVLASPLAGNADEDEPLAWPSGRGPGSDFARAHVMLVTDGREGREIVTVS